MFLTDESIHCACVILFVSSQNSPVKELKSFPQDLVLVGRSSVLIKGLSSRLGIPWSLAREWAPIARNVLDPTSELNTGKKIGRTRFREVITVLKQWGKGRGEEIFKKLPKSLQTRVAKIIVKRQEKESEK